jgi:peptidoglycan/xylan/chitin deacetylase (PgdA/CDA1 family)
MWKAFSGDFDPSLSVKRCIKNIITAARPGAIFVFHDSLKAREKMLPALSEVIDILKEKGYSFGLLSDFI